MSKQSTPKFEAAKQFLLDNKDIFNFSGLAKRIGMNPVHFNNAFRAEKESRHYREIAGKYHEPLFELLDKIGWQYGQEINESRH